MRLGKGIGFTPKLNASRKFLCDAELHTLLPLTYFLPKSPHAISTSPSAHSNQARDFVDLCGMGICRAWSERLLLAKLTKHEGGWKSGRYLPPYFNSLFRWIGSRGSRKYPKMSIKIEKMFPTKGMDEAAYGEIIQLVKKAGAWDQVSQLNGKRLNKEFWMGGLPEDLRKELEGYVVEEEVTGVRLSKLKEEIDL